jgi:ASC-1-like (ASCH) protein
VHVKATFHFEIKPAWEEAIKRGEKTVDARTNASPFADVKVGDVIRFGSARVKVIRVNAYPGVNDLLVAEGFDKVVPGAAGLEEAKHALMDQLHHFHPPHGILAFEIELLKEG